MEVGDIMKREDKILAIVIGSAIISAGFACIPILVPLMHIFALISVGFFFYWIMGEHDE